MCKPVLIFVCLASLLGSESLLASGQQAAPHKIGLVLSGGGARGAAHIGVLKVLEREGIPIDCIAGTSFGAIVGGLYSLGYKAAEIEKIFSGQDWHNVFSGAPERSLSPLFERKNLRYQGQVSFVGLSPELPSGLSSGQRIIEILNALTSRGMLEADYDFDRLHIPFRAVATDLLTGEKYVFSKGSMTEALRASLAVPMLFTPVEKGNMLLVDGGLSDNLPADLARDMGADYIVGVDVTSPLLKKDEIRTVVNVLDQSISLLMKQNETGNLALVNFMIKPDLNGFSYSSYGSMEQVIQRGEQAAEDAIAALKQVLGNVPAGPDELAPEKDNESPIIESIAFAGLEKISAKQLMNEIKSRVGGPADPRVLRSDLQRLYATRLFENVDFTLQRLESGRYALVYHVKEAAFRTLGASIRYDKDYKFVALAEFVARQLFGSPSTATLSSQFGGLEDHSAALRYINPHLPQFFIEPKVHLRRRERLDIRDKMQVDKYTDKRTGGQLAVGGTFFKRLEVEAAYRDDVVSISGGTAPNRQDEPLQLAGLTLRARRDTLDAQEFPRSGMYLSFQVDKRSEDLGSDVGFSKWHGDAERYFSLSRKSTIGITASAGYSRGPMPFFERFYVGGYSFVEGGSRQFFGFTRDELPARQMLILGGSYRREVFSHPLSFAKRGFVYAFYNAAELSDQESAPYHFRLYNGAALGFAIDSMIGPLRIAGAWGDGGRLRLYLSLGPSF